MDLNFRLEILNNSSQISGDTMNKMLQTIEVIDKLCGIKLNEENGSMLITHMAIAIERIKKEEFIEFQDEDMLGQIKAHHKFYIAEKVLCELEKSLKIHFPKGEQWFILMHLCALLGGEDVKV